MVKWYAPWYKGLAARKDQLERLKAAGIVGVEMGNINEEVELLKAAGMEFSPMGPGFGKTLNPASEETVMAFDDPRILEVCRMSDTGRVILRCGYSGENIVKMIAYPNLVRADGLVTDRQVMLNKLSNNLNAITEKLGGKIRVALETLDYSRPGQKVDWSVQVGVAADPNNRAEFEKIIEEEGTNAALKFVTEADFVGDLLDNTSAQFVVCLPHMYISADSKIATGDYRRTIKGAFQDMNNAARGKIVEMHLSVPSGNRETGYADHKLPLDDSVTSAEVMELGRFVLESNPGLELIVAEAVPKKDTVEAFVDFHIAEVNKYKRGLGI